jgi:hypothetical protein
MKNNLKETDKWSYLLYESSLYELVIQKEILIASAFCTSFWVPELE